MPPNLGDFDGTAPPPVGGGGGGGGDGGLNGDAGVSAIAAASNPRGIFLANGYVYFTNNASGAADGTVSAVSTAGGAVFNLATGLGGPAALSVASGVVFFTLSPASGTGGVSAVAVTGGAVTPIRQSVTGARAIVADATNVYWAIDSGSGGPAILEWVPIAGGTVKQLSAVTGDASPTALALLGNALFLATTGTQAAIFQGITTGAGGLNQLDVPAPLTFADVVASSSNVYAVIDDGAPSGAIVNYPRGTGSPSTIASSLNHPQRLALDGSNLYFTDPLGGNVWVLNVSTPTIPPALYVSGLNAPLPIAVADALYVGDADAIIRIPKL